MNKEYIIITPVHNEQKYITKTIDSVITQTVLPSAWIIVDDDSADQTPEIVQKYTRKYSWIKYVHRRKNKGESYYASNVFAIQKGYEYIRSLSYKYLAILDGDISLPPDYYQNIILRMESDSKLGIASGVYRDNVRGKLKKVLHDRRSTPKALMVFRKQCHKDIGGFIPMQYGGEDTVACFMARMKGWKTWSFPDLIAIHNKPIGTGQARNTLKIRFRQGVGEYYLATQPLFFFIKSLRRCIKEPPYIIGGTFRILGYVYGQLMKQDKQLPDNLIEYIHKEQLDRVVKGNRIPDEFRVDISI